MKVIIELDFDYKPYDADVINYLHELINNNCLDWYIEDDTNENSN